MPHRPTGDEAPTTPAVRTVLAYTEEVRDRARGAMADADHTPDWQDRPSPHTRHPGAPRLPLPPARPGLGARAGDAGFTLDRLAETLHLLAGPLARRTQIDWNLDHRTRARLRTAVWSRGTPSGGANHPWELYWSPAPGLPLPPGLLHYDSGHHALERLVTGDLTPAVRAALDPAAPHEPPPAGDGGYLVVTARPWKTAFKYGSFSHHVLCHDIGALLGGWEALTAGTARRATPRFRFDQEALDTALGLPAEESAHVVLPLPWDPTDRTAAGARAPAPNPHRADRADRPRAAERSLRTRTFARAEAVRRAEAETTPTTRPAPPAPREPSTRTTATAPTAPPVPLPVPAPAPRLDPADLLPRRHSVNGRLDPLAPLTAAELGAVLHAAATGTGALESGAPLTTLRVAVRRVHGVPAGGYRYDPESRALIRLPAPDEEPLLPEQRDYALRNHAVTHAAALPVLGWTPGPAMAAHGPRAHRAALAEAGARAQAAHLAARAHALGCGPALGMDARAMDRLLTGDAPRTRTLICLFLGRPLPGEAALDLRLP
ncbi:hypothetical protein ACN20G_28540 (plasmid) [Streptomyces sp. BI20]|uniref:hypothetical protein n=1 Tax=Streptomyces sp. BI20 TaxID=3403460 RepID=UPI003C728C49